MLLHLMIQKQPKEMMQKIKSRIKDYIMPFLLAKLFQEKAIGLNGKNNLDSGFSPPMLEEIEEEYKFVKGDMVFALNLDGTILRLIVEKEMRYNETGDLLSVLNTETGQSMSVKIDSLLKEMEFIAVVPSNMFQMTGKDVVFTEAAEEMINKLTDSVPTLYDDHELAELPDDFQTQEQQQDVTPENLSNAHWIIQVIQEQDSSPDPEVSGPSGVRYNSSLTQNFAESGAESDEPVVKKRKKVSKKQILEDEISGEEDVDMENGSNYHTAAVGDYVALMYEGTPYMGEVKAIHPEAGYQIKTLKNDMTSCFKWTGEKEDIWYKNISFLVAHPCPANNRGAWKFSDSDFEKFKCL